MFIFADKNTAIINIFFIYLPCFEIFRFLIGSRNSKTLKNGILKQNKN